jgi:hypothetical protein
MPGLILPGSAVWASPDPIFWSRCLNSSLNELGVSGGALVCWDCFILVRNFQNPSRLSVQP